MGETIYDILEQYFGVFVSYKDYENINTAVAQSEANHKIICEVMNRLSNYMPEIEPDWEEYITENFYDNMYKYIMDSGKLSDLSDTKAERYVPYEFTHCAICSSRCYFGCYPNAYACKNEHIDGFICEHCHNIDAMLKTNNRKGENNP